MLVLVALGPAVNAGGSSKIQIATTPPAPTPCVVAPSSCGYPDASNTGVPTGTTLTASPGGNIVQAGAVVNGLDVAGALVIKANNVTVENSRVTCPACHYAIQIRPGVTGTVLTDLEVVGLVGGGGSYTLERGNVHGGVDGVHVETGTTIQDSYIHDLAPTLLSHDDTIQQIGLTDDSVRIVHNTLEPYNQTTQVYNDAAYICGSKCQATTNLTFTDNLLDGGSHTLYCPNAGAAGNVFARNRFGPDSRSTVITQACKTNPGNSFDATNVWDSTGLPV